MSSNYSECPPPDHVIVAKDLKRTLDYLGALEITTPFQMTVFLHQVRAARPARWFVDSAWQSLPMAFFHADSDLWRNDFGWSGVKSALEAILQAFTDKAWVRLDTLSGMIAACLVSEFLGYPAICQWSHAALSSRDFCDPLPLQRLFPWDSQLWVHCCLELEDRERMLRRGLNPALVMCTRRRAGRSDLLTRLCPEKAHKLAKEHLQLHKALSSSGDENLVDELCTRKPHLFGLNELGCFSRARSSQDSLSFHREEQDLRCRMFRVGVAANASAAVLHAIDTLFALKSGQQLTAVSDCSFAYRHRSRQDHELAHLTEPELCGLVRHMADARSEHRDGRRLGRAFEQLQARLEGQALIESLAGGCLSELDESRLILEQLQAIDIPFAVFLDGCPVEGLLLFVSYPLGLRLKRREAARPIFVFTSVSKTSQRGIDHRFLERLVAQDPLLRQGVEVGLLHIVETQQIAEGIHVRQMGVAAQRILLDIANNQGVLLSCQEDALMTLKNLALPWINIGRANCEQVVALSGLERGDGYAILHVPPAPPFVGFPVVNRTILDAKQGRPPLVLGSDDPDITKEAICGETRDGTPFSGVLIKIAPAAKRRYRLRVTLSPQPQPLSILVEQYQDRTGRQVALAWNGGYFVSSEFQEKQGFPASFRGQPVGLLKIDRRVLCLPLFDRRPVLVVDRRGDWAIKTLDVARIKIGFQEYGSPMVSARYCKDFGGGTLGRDEIRLYGIQNPPPLVPEDYVAIRFLFDEILQILDGSEPFHQLAVPHHTLVLPKSKCHPAWRPGVRLSFGLDGYDDYYTMIEAGPQLIRAERPCLGLEREGWTDPESKALQAAPVHFEDLRTARTAFCTLKDGGLAACTINSRTGESTGLTHLELIELIQEKLPGQVRDAMEFDSGGSVTLMSGQQVLSICSTWGWDGDGRKPRALARPIATAVLLTAT